MATIVLVHGIAQEQKSADTGGGMAAQSGRRSADGRLPAGR